jgi:hypothetical protein
MLRVNYFLIARSYVAMIARAVGNPSLNLESRVLCYGSRLFTTKVLEDIDNRVVEVDISGHYSAKVEL